MARHRDVLLGVVAAIQVGRHPTADAYLLQRHPHRADAARGATVSPTSRRFQMLACLFVHTVAMAGGVGLIIGWQFAPIGAVAGVALAIYDEVLERRRSRETQRSLATRGQG